MRAAALLDPDVKPPDADASRKAGGGGTPGGHTAGDTLGTTSDEGESPSNST
jgi:hypothetical protein